MNHSIFEIFQFKILSTTSNNKILLWGKFLENSTRNSSSLRKLFWIPSSFFVEKVHSEKFFLKEILSSYNSTGILSSRPLHHHIYVAVGLRNLSHTLVSHSKTAPDIFQQTKAACWQNPSLRILERVSYYSWYNEIQYYGSCFVSWNIQIDCIPARTEK